MIFYVSVPLEGLEENIDFIAGEGFYPEIRMASVDHLTSLRQSDLDRLRGLLEERSLSTFTHGPFFGLDIASLDRRISEYTAESFERGLEVTAALGGKVMVIHTGYLPLFSRGGRRHWFRNWSRRMPQIVKKARGFGVTLALENTWEDRPEVLAHLLGMLPRDEVGVCLDTGHLNAFSSLPVARWWNCVGDRIVALHLHDNDGISDDHLAPGRGTFDFGTLAGFLEGLDPFPLIDLEVDHAHALEGRRYLEGIFGVSG